MADRPAATAAQIETVWRELGKPSPEKLHVALRKRGLFPPTLKVLREHFYRFQSSRQVFRNPPKYTGHMYSTGLDNKWIADIAHFPEAEFQGKTWKYALLVVDEFSRHLWASLIASPMSAAEGYRAILRRAGHAPDQLLTDGDPGFQTPEFKEALKGTLHQLKRGAQDLSVVDRAIGTLKRRDRQHELDGEEGNWASRLQSSVDAFNRSGAPALHGSAPEDLRGHGGRVESKVLYFDRMWDESHNMQANAAAIHRRAEALEGVGAFRTLAPFAGPKRRIGDPVWSLQKHGVRKVSNATVEDERGERFLTKEVLPVHAESTELTAPAPKLNAKARGMLQRYADRGRAFLQGQPERTATATKFQAVLAQEGNLKEALKLAGVSSQAVVRGLVQAFPDTFRMETAKTGGAAHVTLVE